jgi:hypothetical protein
MGEEDTTESSAEASAKYLYFHVPGVASVRWDPGLQAVVETWEGWANAEEFLAMLEAGVRALTENGGSRWLADCRLQRVMKAADQEAGSKRWLPRALAAGMRRFAVVLPDSGLAKANIQENLRAAAAARMEMAYFATVDEAGRWLRELPGSSETKSRVSP